MTGDVGAEGLPQPLDEETKKRIAAAGAAAHRLQQQGRTEG